MELSERIIDELFGDNRFPEGGYWIEVKRHEFGPPRTVNTVRLPELRTLLDRHLAAPSPAPAAAQECVIDYDHSEGSAWDWCLAHGRKISECRAAADAPAPLTIIGQAQADGEVFVLLEDGRGQYVFTQRLDDAEQWAVFSECMVGSTTAREVYEAANNYLLATDRAAAQAGEGV